MEFNNPIVGEEELIRSAIRSQNYVAGATGWRIAADGSAEFTQITLGSTGVNTQIEITGGSFTLRDPNTMTTWYTIGLGYAGYGAYSNANDVDSDQLAHAQGMLVWNTDDIDTNQRPTIRYDGNGAASPHQWVFRSGKPASGAQPEGVDVHFVNTTDAATTSPAFELDSTNAGFPVDFRQNGIDRGRGIEDYVNVVANTAAGTAEVAHVTSNTVDFVEGRAYRITYHYQGQCVASGDRVGFRLRRATLLGTSLFDSLQTHTAPAANAIMNGETSQIVFNNTGSLLSTVIIGSVYRSGGVGGNVLGFANAANPVWLEITDVGDVNDYPGAKAL